MLVSEHTNAHDRLWFITPPFSFVFSLATIASTTRNNYLDFSCLKIIRKVCSRNVRTMVKHRQK